MNFLTRLIVESMSDAGLPRYPAYEKIISHCFDVASPPFIKASFGRRYFELARNAEWFANSLVANSALEGYGATQIWKFSRRIPNDVYASAVRQHAMDESRHSTMFIRMLELVFPGIEYSSFTKERIDQLQPRFSTKRHPPLEKLPEDQLLTPRRALDELIQVHITEIRALVLQQLLRPALLQYAPGTSQRPLISASDRLISDEAKHIGYTAKIFEEQTSKTDLDFLFDAFESHVREFNDLTLLELERETIEL